MPELQGKSFFYIDKIALNIFIGFLKPHYFLALVTELWGFTTFDQYNFPSLVVKNSHVNRKLILKKDMNSFSERITNHVFVVFILSTIHSIHLMIKGI